MEQSRAGVFQQKEELLEKDHIGMSWIRVFLLKVGALTVAS